MKQLCYKTLEEAGYSGFLLKDAPEKVMQFGEGNFLRAFADAFFDLANERTDWNGKVLLVQPIREGLAQPINRQDGLYTLYLRGRENGKQVDKRRLISAVSRCINPYEDFDQVLQAACSSDLEIIVSNTTEAGICYDPNSGFAQDPPASFPAKLTRILYERFRAGKKGLIILSCELIDNNGRELCSIVKRHSREWGLEDGFMEWLDRENVFCSTLVDRIVPGRIRDPQQAEALERENGYRDDLMDMAEVFGVWIIEGEKELEEKLPFRRAGLNVQVATDITPYKQRKVRILNGAHTGFALGAFLAGETIVRDCMENEIISGFMKQMISQEIIPTLSLPEEELTSFAASTAERFANPFIDHELLSIALNSTSKWRTRNLPSLLAYREKTGQLPPCLTVSLAACIAFYSSGIQRLEDGRLICRQEQGKEYAVQDEQWILEFYFRHRDDDARRLTAAVLAEERMWGKNLRTVDGLEEETAKALQKIRQEGALAAFASCMSGKKETMRK